MLDVLRRASAGTRSAQGPMLHDGISEPKSLGRPTTPEGTRAAPEATPATAGKDRA